MGLGNAFQILESTHVGKERGSMKGLLIDIILAALLPQGKKSRIKKGRGRYKVLVRGKKHYAENQEAWVLIYILLLICSDLSCDFASLGLSFHTYEMSGLEFKKSP